MRNRYLKVNVNVHAPVLQSGYIFKSKASNQLTWQAD